MKTPQKESLQDKIQKAIELLKDAGHPSKIILFGSHARGNATEDSDIDFLVIKPNVKDRINDMVVLNRILSPLRLSVDILVVSEEIFNEWCSTPGNVYYEAAVEGKIVYDSAA